jgi:hypothetical protein
MAIAGASAFPLVIQPDRFSLSCNEPVILNPKPIDNQYQQLRAATHGLFREPGAAATVDNLFSLLVL